MYCQECGHELPPGARFCPSCSGPANPATKTARALKQAADASVNLTKKAAKAAKPTARSAVRLTGRALARLGSLTRRAGERLERMPPGPTKSEEKHVVGPETPIGSAVDVNTASVEELMTLPGVGRAKAKSLIARRPFRSLDDVVDVPGISRGMLDRLRGQLIVAPP